MFSPFLQKIGVTLGFLIDQFHGIFCKLNAFVFGWIDEGLACFFQCQGADEGRGRSSKFTPVYKILINWDKLHQINQGGGRTAGPVGRGVGSGRLTFPSLPLRGGRI